MDTHSLTNPASIKSQRKTVAIMGAGIAGLTAAHELLQRGYGVTIIDKKPLDEWGGKARSYSAVPQKIDHKSELARPLPLMEHGFHFFPGFYRHLDDTLGRIPSDGGTVISNLNSVREELLAATGKPRIKVPAAAPRRPSLVDGIRTFLQVPKDLLDVGLTKEDLSIFAGKIWRFASSCPERRDGEYEGVDWRTFVESLDRSEEYYWYLASGLTRTLVAAKARRASAKTMGNVALQIILCMTERNNTSDRVLNGPANSQWFAPWLSYLETKYGKAKGDGSLECRGETEVRDVVVENGKVVSIILAGKNPDKVTFDYVVSALPLEVLVEIVHNNEKFVAAYGGEKVRCLKLLAEEYLTKMSGMQIFLRRDVPICNGHQIFPDSPWGLTSISQKQFWSEEWQNRLSELDVGGILSVDISSWDMPGLNNGPSANESKPTQIFEEVKKQLALGLGDDILSADNIIGWHLDENPEPILVNGKSTWGFRPTTECAVTNLFFSGDYVQTRTDLACMEGANESGRRAVNEILRSDGRKGEDCKLFEPTEREPRWLKVFQEMDLHRYRRGLPWGGIDLSEVVLSGSWFLDTIGDVIFADDKRTTSENAPASKSGPLRLPRELWYPNSRPALTGDAKAAMVSAAVASARPLTDKNIEEILDPDSASPGRKDPMFQRWRLYELDYADSRFAVPFHVYDGDTLVIHGRTNLNALKELTDGTGYYPVAGVGPDGGKCGYAELWIVDYRDTSAGPYREIVINFVVTKVEDHQEYRWRNPYSSLVPMMDSANRLFTPVLLVDQEKPKGVGAIRYGNELFGTNKQKASITIVRTAGAIGFKCSQKGDQILLSGKVRENGSPFQDIADSTGLARELGLAEMVRDAGQAWRNEEVEGGLVTRDARVNCLTGPPLEIQASYKFAPRLHVLKGTDEVIFNKDGQDMFSEVIRKMQFDPTIAAVDHHLKSVLYLDGWPTPEGPVLS